MNCTACGGTGTNGEDICRYCGGTGAADLAMPRLVPAPPDNEAGDQTGLGTGTTSMYSPSQDMRGQGSQ